MSEFNWFGLAVFSAVLLATPGPAVISLLYSGVNYGFRKSLPYLFGIITGFVFNLVVSALGAGALLEFDGVYTALKFVMLGYIFYLAYKIATSAPLGDGGEAKPLHFFQGVLLNMLNPKAYTAALSAISQFSLVDHYAQSAFWIVIVNAAIVFVVDVSWCFSGQYLKRLFAHPKWHKWVNVSLASLMVLSVVWTYLR